MTFSEAITALCVWREARGEPLDGQRAVTHVIKNRGGDVLETITKPWQFSSMTAKGDSQLVVYPKSDDLIFQQILAVVDQVFNHNDPDPTNGATHYFNPSVVLPSWAKTMTKVASIGHHDFYK